MAATVGCNGDSSIAFNFIQYAYVLALTSKRERGETPFDLKETRLCVEKMQNKF